MHHDVLLPLLDDFLKTNFDFHIVELNLFIVTETVITVTVILCDKLKFTVLQEQSLREKDLASLNILVVLVRVWICDQIFNQLSEGIDLRFGFLSK
jgi:hypothetical protein